MDGRLLNALAGCDLWAMDELHLHQLAALASNVKVEPIEARPARAEEPLEIVGRIGLLGVYGYVSHRPSLFSSIFGGAATTSLGGQLAAMVANPEVDAVLMDVSSPGGSVYGVEELARQIRAAREVKPVVAVANAYAFSAAYYLASQASELAVIPSGEVGSVGVVLVCMEESKYLEKEGIAVNIIRAGKYKAEGNPYEPLNDEARAYLQSRVDDYYTMFVKAVAEGRRTTTDAVLADFGQGRPVGADAALKAGMVDRIATLEEEVQRMAGAIAARRSGQRATALAEDALARLELCRQRLHLAEAET